MRYYKVKKSADQKPIKNTNLFLVQDELFTAKEIILHDIRLADIEPVKIDKNKTYFFFGARFLEKQESIF